MHNTDEDPLPEAYLRLIAAQRVVTPEEMKEIDAEVAREQQLSRIRRNLPKVY